MTRPVPFRPGNLRHGAVFEGVIDGIGSGKVTIAALVGAAPGEYLEALPPWQLTLLQLVLVVGGFADVGVKVFGKPINVFVPLATTL